MRLTHAKLLLLGNQGAAGPAPFSDDFNRADGALGNGWTGATWAIASGAAVNTPTTGSELITNGTFDTDISGWTDISGGTSSVEWVNDGQPAGGLRLIGGGSINRANAVQAITTIPGEFYRFYRYNMSSSINGLVGTTSGASNVMNTLGLTGDQPTIFLSPQAALYVSVNSTFERVVDNISVKPISDLIAYRTLTAGNAYAETAVNYAQTQSVATHGGIVHYVDVNNYVAAYYYCWYERIILEKRVGGVRTELANAAATYSAGAKVRLTRSGTSYAVAYGGSTLINATAVADAVFATADKWGLFSTNRNASFDGFDWAAT